MKYLRENRLPLLLAVCALATAGPGWASPLVYYGGPVVSNAQIVMVNWGSNVPAAVQTGMPGFYGDVVQSGYWTIFREYATNILANDGGPGSNQQIRFGAFAGTYTIVPSRCAGTTACTLSDTELDAELASQITAGHLPVPATDAAGNVNSVYMVHFHPSVTITIFNGSAQSCAQFCSASAKFSYTGLTVPAGIMPDQGGACALGCGGGAPTYFQTETVVSMYTLANLVTDPQVAGTISVGRPLAWYNSSQGQISDICNSGSDFGAIVANGTTYTVNKLWSNQHAACILSNNVYVVKPSAGANGSISPGDLQAVDSGQSANFTVTPDAGYSAIVGGTCGGTLFGGTTYITNAVSADCTVTASFIDRIFADGFEGP